MADRLDEVLAGREGNYLLPFVWQRGEPEDIIRDEIDHIYRSGIRSICVEARPHPDFLGPKWWQDMDILMEEAKKRGMRVWVLDDDHFPTGHAAGNLKNVPKEFRRLFVREQHLDAIGPKPNGSFMVKPFFNNFFQLPSESTQILAVIAARRDPQKDQLLGDYVDLTDLIQGDFINWDIPEGYWRIFFVFATQDGGSPSQKEYLNPLVPESVRVLLNSVYEPFYEHYGENFGSTFAGFFSDEPGFYNDNLQPYDYASSVGKKGIDLPWRADLLALLSDEIGLNCRHWLPLLWYEGGEETRRIRYAYMNLVSRLYGEHFTQQIGDWCRKHHVEYIGHIIEDNGTHARLGCGAGHYFRALWGQDLAGIDVVLWQLAPGFDQGYFTNVSGQGEGSFYHYGLTKMASSLGHIDPKKQGRTVCEIFGAYGWVEGLKLMKWLTDHMLVRGVNYFVPHAFSQANFPDPDCPPHFYARGNNPQYRYYRELNMYTNRLCHLLSGEHVAPVAVLYHAEAEWSGSYMPFHLPVMTLMQHQIDCDVVAADVLVDSARVVHGQLRVTNETYHALILPYSQGLPEKLIDKLLMMANQALPIIFIDRLPEFLSEKTKKDSEEILESLSLLPSVRVVPLASLAQFIRERSWHEIETDSFQPYLRSLHIRQAILDVYFFTNEHPYSSLKTNILIYGEEKPLMVYDAFNNQMMHIKSQRTPRGSCFLLNLSPYESLAVIAGDGDWRKTAEPEMPHSENLSLSLELGNPWLVSIATAEQYPAFTPWRTINHLFDLSNPEALPSFSGTFRYETEFDWDHSFDRVFLDLGQLFETAEIWLNNTQEGIRICPPYRVELKGLKKGRNRLVIEVTNTLARQQQDFLSRFTAQDPSGLLGPVRLLA